MKAFILLGFAFAGLGGANPPGSERSSALTSRGGGCAQFSDSNNVASCKQLYENILELNNGINEKNALAKAKEVPTKVAEFVEAIKKSGNKHDLELFANLPSLQKYLAN